MSSSEQDTLEGIAIIGMAGRFPGAKNVDEFWQNIKDGVESITNFSDQELESEGIDPDLLRLPNYVKAGAILEDTDLFDAFFFGFTPREAEITDPQHRLFLECAWEAMENAGYSSNHYDGSVGVFAGTTWSTYLFNLFQYAGKMDFVDSFRIMLGNEKDHLPTWISYKLNLKGPSVNVQTACSTSLVAVHLACQSLLNYQSDISLAGGVTVSVPQKEGYIYVEGGISSPDGHCRAFDANAAGSVGGSAVGIVVLKRLEEALTDGDTIHAVIKGSAINNDGSTKVGYTAPSVDGQLDVITTAMAIAGVEPETVTCIETHGSGTKLGDPIEVTALSQVYQGTNRKNFVALGSVKTNIGHTGAAAGISGLIKGVQAIKHKLIPPSLHFVKPNPHIDFSNSPFYVSTRLTEWPSNGLPRRAGISSFGIGGTNAHAVIEEAPPQEPSGPSRPYQLLLLSAKNNSVLEKATDNLAAHLKGWGGEQQQNLADVAYTLQVGRKDFDFRRMLVCNNHEDAAQALNERRSGRIFDGIRGGGEQKDRSVAFMFPGLGDLYVNMGLGIYQNEIKFREQVDQCCELFKPYLGIDLRHVLYPGSKEEARNISPQVISANRANIDLRMMLSGRNRQADRAVGADDETQMLNQTQIAQPALFVIEYSLARLWIEWGLSPRAMIGYSIGEYVAACLAGVFSLEDAVRLVAKRAQLIQGLIGGSMLAVSLPENELQVFLSDELSIAGINGPSMCVVSGTSETVAHLEMKLNSKGVACKQLPTKHAYHSEMMRPITDEFAALFRSVKLHPPLIPYVSNVTGTWITGSEAIDQDYWVKHLCGTVRFGDGIRELVSGNKHLFLEVGPGQMLSSLVIQQTQINESAVRMALTSMRHVYDRQDDSVFLLNTLGQLWLEGIDVDWAKYYANEKRSRVPLPTYPFERQRYWVPHTNQFINNQRARENGVAKLQGSEDFTLKSFHPRSTIGPAYVAPDGPIEEKIAEIWQDLFGIESVGAQDDFFYLGGNSLIGIKFITLIRQAFDVNIPIQSIFEASTVRDLASVIEDALLTQIENIDEANA